MAIIKTTDGDGTSVYAGEYRLACFTLATDMAKIDRFVALCQEQEDTLLRLGKAYAEAIAYNQASQGQGKNWPVFGQRERAIGKLCAMAGIVDT